MQSQDRLSVFITTVRLSLRQTLAEPLMSFGQFAAYATLITLYGYIFRAIPPEALLSKGFAPQDMVWYLGATELPLFCFPSFSGRQFQITIQKGDYEPALLRPCSGWITMLGDWLGTGIGSTLYMLGPAYILTGCVAGTWLTSPFAIAGFLASLLLAGIGLLCLNFTIGAACLWLKQSEPLLWLLYKSMFLFGALLWPLSFYPKWLAIAVWFTPFPAFLGVVGHWTLPFAHDLLLAGLGFQIIWVCLLVLFVSFLDRAILRRLQNMVAT